MANDGSLIFDTSIDTKGVEEGLEKIKKTADGYSVGKNIFSNLATDAIQAAGGALLDAAEAGMEFEASMAKVQATSSATGKQLDELTNLAREYGASTVFSSSECADALNYMAMAGWDVEQMTNGLPGILNLAAASGEDLALTSDIVTDALTAFGMQAEESAHFADILATASSKSNTNVSMMGETFKYVAPVAGALGYSAEDVAVAVGLMANSGIKAGQAGTSLRAILSNLTQPTDAQAAAMGALGISLTNTSGGMKSLDELLEDLRTGFSGLNEAEQASFASIIGGQEAMSGLLAIVNASDTDFSNLKTAIYDCDGACDQMSATMTDNVKGGLAELSSAAEDAQIEIYDAVEPMIRDALPGIKDVFGWIKDNAGSIANLLKPIGGALQVVFAVLKPVLNILSPILNFVGKITGAIGDAATVLSQDFTEAICGIEEYNGTMKECSAEIDAVSQSLKVAKDEYGENSDEVRKLQMELDTLHAQYRKGGGDAAVYSEKITEMAESFDELKTSQEEAMDSIDNTEDSGLRAVSMLEKFSGKTELTSNDLDVMSKYADYLNDTFECDIQVNYDTGELTGFDPAAIVKQIQNKINENRSAQAFDFITSEEFSSGYLEAAEAYYDNYLKLRNMQVEFDQLSKTAYYDANGIKRYANDGRYKELSEQLPKMREEVENNLAVIDGMNTEIEENGRLAGLDAEAIEVLQEAMMESARTGSDFISVEEETNNQLTEQEAKLQEMQYGVESAQGVITEYKDRILEVAQAYDDAYTAAYNSFSGQFGLFDQAQADADATVYSAQTALESQLTFWQTYNDNLQTLRSMSAEELGITQENFDLLLSTLSDGSVESAGLAQNLVNGDDSAIAAMATTLGELDKTQQETARTVQEINFDLNEAMAEVESDMETAIEDLNLSSDAEAAALDTMHSYIDGITSSMAEAQSAAQSVVDAVKAVFANTDLSFSASGISGAVQIEGNASGTTNSSDVFVAGENGPELIVGKKGSTVFPTSETAKIIAAVSGTLGIMNAQGAGSVSAYSPVYQQVYTSPAATGTAAAHSESSQSVSVQPKISVYIGDREIEDFVIETVTNENANSGGWSV